MVTNNDAERADGDVSRRGFLRATGAAGASVALTGTGAAESDGEVTDQQTTTQGQSGGTLRLINQSMSTLDPVKASDTASGEVTGQIFDGLLNWPDGGIPVEPLIAAGYERSDDFTTYTFDLKQGVQFHNDDEVTAQDIVYSWERLAASDNSRAKADILTSVGVVHETDDEGAYVPESMGVEAVGDYTVRLNIEQPFASVLQVLANNQFAAVPEGIVGDIQGYDGRMDYQQFATANPVGAGPFTFENWSRETEAVVSAFENYHGTGPRVDRVHWQIITSPNARYNYAMNRNADAFTIPTSRYDQSKVSVENTDEKGREVGTYGPARNGETLDYLSVVTLNVFYIGFNMTRVEEPARKATAYAMNQQQVIDQVFKGRGSAAYHYTAPPVYPGGASAYEQHAEQNYPYGYDQTQLDQARQVMEEAGYGPNNKYSFELIAYESSQAWQSVGQLLRDKLASAHIDLNMRVAPFSALLKQVRQGNVDAFTLGWIVPWAAPDAFVKHLNPATSDPSLGAPESYNNWPEDSQSAQRAIQAWQKIQNNPAPTDQARQVRTEAAITMEEANWEAMANLPVYHESEERFHYQWADLQKFGVGGSYKQKYNEATVGDRP
ncbi:MULTISPECIES: ABC transporter substrate-binding protein [Halorussus]|uniref:ABC transporter substrate-binding protein n=1 Tax=Halorussus TaxID=1070314 RepID=UPI000E2103D3|nr:MULTISPECIES: ABC transporter substrate-binding protein [Halorussus]NHN60796.1 twin-arginine translocation signal domain-containing protein [Halorussus sp. JP-T4]